MKKIIVIDNYDSFVYNLVHYLEDLNCKVSVKRNDEIYIDEIEDYDKILISPGPGLPNEAANLGKIISTYAPSKPMLGVCLGQQAIAEFFGGLLYNLEKVYHGVATKISITEEASILFKDLPKEIEVGRYHSWGVQNLPNVLIPTSYDENGQIMSFKHSYLPIFAVQFHPESVLTPYGKKILQNWVEHS